MTEYVVLAKDAGSWLEIAKVESRTARGAVSAVLMKEEQALPREFVAIPLRSWQPVKVQVETALKFS